MAFVAGLVLGIIAGLGLVIAFLRSEHSRSKSRLELAAILAAFAKMTVEDSRKILPGEFYPSWVVFSRRQKLKWLNQELIKIWPYINEAASELIRSSVEPVLEQYRPVMLASLKFSKLTLGTVAPQFTGVSIIEDDKSAITMELEMQWDGNPNIVLDIQTKFGVAFPIQVKDIGFTGVFRLIFKPLVEELPCFGAISYSLREKKYLDYTLKVIAGDMSSITGISGAIKETIHNAIEDSITWPARKVVPILPGDYSFLELKPVGILEVKLVQARNLTDNDIIGKSDPFALLHVRPLPDRIKKSKTINNNLNPIWNEHFEFIVEDAATQHLVVKVYDEDGVQASELIGCAQVMLNDLHPGKVKGVWLKLVKDLEVQRDRKDRGQVYLELLYCPFGTEREFPNPFAKQLSLTSLEKVLANGANGTKVADFERARQRKRVGMARGVLSVSVISAVNLPAMDITGKSDPYVVLKMMKTEMRNRTRVVNESLNPIWHETFHFVVEDGLHDLLILEVWDHDMLKKDFIGRCIITLTRVIIEEEFADSFCIEGSEIGKLNLSLKWTPQPIYQDI
ncbi:synaptotagmin-5-like [Phoenix dactylifera]|uniref:Synaptotagmin-5-like n=1 Tax=Phoenix dactylifera TaxID=42345 RepID=A0A8B8J968_PHODC|nr:synaptotagmin-5-like [Phoenix dactylifera]